MNTTATIEVYTDDTLVASLGEWYLIHLKADLDAGVDKLIAAANVLLPTTTKLIVNAIGGRAAHEEAIDIARLLATDE